MTACRRHNQNQRLQPELRERIERHPCFCEDASHYYARLHLPVAPRCNVQCGFCDRRYDCSNETRPGVTSKLISPQEALERVRLVYERLPNLSVVGIAGPGDPLANPRLTFETLELVTTHFPELKLCLSTNGLYLPEHAARIAALGVGFVTVSIMAVDPVIAAQIYLWVRLDGKILRGREAAEVMIERQLKGLRMLAESNVLVKVNTVLIPGLNSEHIPKLAQRVKAEGAGMLNIMPLIPVSGSAFAQRHAPTFLEVLNTRSVASETIHLIQHCRQCRADAVGRLGEDLSGEMEGLFLEKQNQNDR